VWLMPFLARRLAGVGPPVRGRRHRNISLRAGIADLFWALRFRKEPGLGDTPKPVVAAGDDRRQHGGVGQRVVESQARDFLAGKYGTVEELQPLGGGSWTSAYSFSHAGRALVVRFGPSKDWFEADRAAVSFSSPGLPVPEVLDVGDAFDGAYAISVRHYGTYLEDVRPDQSDVAGPMLASLLGALFSVPKSPDLPVGWHERPLHSGLSWRDWLCDRLADDPGRPVHGWRATIRAQSDLDRIFRASEARVRDLAGACPERRDLVHGDLLHANVLVTEDASRPNAVFSWKLSVRGDFLYDTAWCTFCTIWYPGIAALDLWHLIHREPSVKDDADALVDAPLRHHCYELCIGLGALAWNAWTGDAHVLQQTAAHLTEVLERGPLPART
jgi:aminoglycoside phosphotransferase (APT) family kinase protein